MFVFLIPGVLERNITLANSYSNMGYYSLYSTLRAKRNLVYFSIFIGMSNLLLGSNKYKWTSPIIIGIGSIPYIHYIKSYGHFL